MLVAIVASCTTFESADPEPAQTSQDGGGLDAAAPGADASPASDAATSADGGPVELYRGTSATPGTDPSSGGATAGRIYGTSVAVDGKNVVWLAGTPGTTIFACPKSGCGSMPAISASVPGNAGALVGDAQGFFFALRFGSAAGVYSFVPGSGTTPLTKTLAQVADLRLSGDRIFMLDRNSTVNGGGVHAMLRDGGSLAPVSPKPNELEIIRMDVSLDTVFIANPDKIYAKSLVDSPDSNPTAIVTTPGSFYSVVVDRTKGAVYYASRDSKLVYRCSTVSAGAGCSSASEISQGKLGSSGPNGLAHDGKRLYVTSDDGNQSQIASCDPEACAGTWKVHVTAPLILGPPAVDEQAIYWLERDAPPDAGNDTYRVMKLAK